MDIMEDEFNDKISRAELEAAKLLAQEGEEAIQEAEESGDLVLKTRAEIARTVLEMEKLGLSVVRDGRACEIAEYSTDCLWTVTLPDFTHEYINPSIKQLLGYSPEEYSASGLRDVVKPDSLERLMQLYKDLAVKVESGELEKDMPLTTEIEAIHKDGHSVFIEASMRFLYGEGGKPTHVLGSSRNITERKHAEDELRNKEALLEAQLNSSIDGILVVDPDGRKILQNQRISELWQIPQHVIEDPDDAQQVQHVMQMTADPEKFAERVRYLYDHPDETTRDEIALINGTFLDRYSAPVLGEDGHNYGRIWTFRDITERKQAEEALAAAKEDLENVLNTVSVSMVQLNREGCITLLNRAGHELIECKEGEAIGLDWFEKVIPEEDRAKTREVFDMLMGGEMQPAEYFENLVQTENGQKKLVAWHNSLVRNQEGEIVGTLSSGEDITERTNLEAHLRQSQKMEVIGQLAGGVAHDFNNLLTGLMGHAQLAGYKLPEDHSAHEDMEEVVRISQRAAELTTSLLAYSKKQILKPRVISVPEAMDNVGKICQRTIPEDRTFSFHYEGALDSIVVDPAQFESVLLNLFVNARDAMPDGGEIRVSVSNVQLTEAGVEQLKNLQAGRHLKICVQDTGIGIPPEQLDTIFEPLFTTKGDRGTGLGLARVDGTVRQSGGNISVKSEVGKGTTFTMLFPSIPADDISDAGGEGRAEVLMGEGNIVVIEDEQVVRTVTQRMLARAGYTAKTFTGGKEALVFFEGEHEGQIPFKPEDTDLVISDVKMPDMNGPELIAEIRKINPSVRVLLVSGHAAYMHGIDTTKYDFAQKPYNMAELSKIVKGVLKSDAERLTKSSIPKQ